MSGFYDEPMKKADYGLWNNTVFVTTNEFIYLASGFHPLPAGQFSFGYLNLSNEKFKTFYAGITRLSEELPHRTILETEVKDIFTPEPKYEAVYLIKWAQLKKFDINKAYQPVMSVERSKIVLTNELRGRETISLNNFARLLAAYNSHVGDEAHFCSLLMSAPGLDESNPAPLETLIGWAKKYNFSLPEEMILQLDKQQKKSDPREITTLQTLLLGIVMKKYEYNPWGEEKSSVTGSSRSSIHRDLDELDLDVLKVGDETIRNALKKAKEKLLPMTDPRKTK